MKNVLRLLRLQIDNKTDILKTATPKKMIRALLKIALIFIAITVVLVTALGRVFIIGFKINAELITVVLFITQLISFVFALGTVINTLYLCKDNEMLICLPTTPNQLFISKILLVYITEFFVNALISVPLFISLGMLTYQNLPFSYYLSIPIMLILMPIFPIVLASLLSVPVMKLINFLKKHTVISIVSIFSLVGICLWSYLVIISKVVTGLNMNEDQYLLVARVDAFIVRFGSNIPMYFQLTKGMLDFAKWYYFIVYILILAVLALITFIVTRYFFFKTSMSSLEKTVKEKSKPRKFRKHNRFSSLLIKEFYCVFRSSSDVFEYFLFTFLMPFIVFLYDKLLKEINVRQAGENMIAGAHIMVVAILAMLSNISSASAISRDGGNFHNSKIIPVDYYRQIFAKFVFNLIFTVGAIVVTSLVSMMYYPVWQICLGSIAVILASVGHIAYCIDTDIKSPTISLQGNESSSTVSKTTPKSLVYGLIIGFIMGIIVMVMSELKNQLIPYLLIIGLSVIFMIYRVNALILRINIAYDEIEM